MLIVDHANPMVVRADAMTHAAIVVDRAPKAKAGVRTADHRKAEVRVRKVVGPVPKAEDLARKAITEDHAAIPRTVVRVVALQKAVALIVDRPNPAVRVVTTTTAAIVKLHRATPARVAGRDAVRKIRK